MLTSRDREALTWIENYKALSINQASILFFNNSYEGARRRLKQLEEMQFLKSYIIKESKEKVYYWNKKIGKHDLLILDFIATMKFNQAELLDYKCKPQYLGGKLIPDAFMIFKYKDRVLFILLEVDLHHYTSNIKMQTYEELFKSEEIKSECFGTFPIILISRPTKGIRYNSKNFHVVYLDLLYNNIESLLLQNSSII